MDQTVLHKHYIEPILFKFTQDLYFRLKVAQEDLVFFYPKPGYFIPFSFIPPGATLSGPKGLTKEVRTSLQRAMFTVIVVSVSLKNSALF